MHMQWLADDKGWVDCDHLKALVFGQALVEIPGGPFSQCFAQHVVAGRPLEIGIAPVIFSVDLFGFGWL